MSEHKGWATPGPAGLVALAVACFCFYAILSGTVQSTAAPIIGIWLLGGFVVQVIVALVELKNGHLTGGNVFLFFSAFFMLVGGMGFIFKYFAALNGWPLDTTVEGWAWLPLFITLILWTPAYLKESSAVMGMVVLLLDVGVFFVTFMDMGVLAHSWAHTASYFILVAGLGALWIAAAGILANAFGRPVLPMPGPILK
ncbi:gpr1/fun34/yaah family protein [hydrocarbon metagenome]|uniref:Gpr1/fun34/yaah family protein n=1 Tax=hydrocarbon metagenome TaxID=938273 RepID=A0A0W8E8G6_9ZZZZ